MNNYDVIILGAGIGGLALAHALCRKGRRVLLAEAEDHVGGVIRSEQVDGYLLERGPNSFSSAPAIDALMEEVGIAPRAIRRPLRDYDRFVFKEGRLRKVPMGPLDLLRTDCLTAGEKMRLVGGLFAAHPPPTRDLSLGEYFRPRLGDGLVDTLLRPFVAGVYAADADQLSFETALPRLFEPATRHPRLISAIREMMANRRRRGRGKRRPKALVSFPGGLEELPRAIHEAIVRAGGEVRLGCPLTLAGRHNGVWSLEGPDGTEFRAGHVVLAQQAREAAQALGRLAPSAAELLREVTYAPLTVVHAGISAWDIRGREKGFGFLNAQLPREWHHRPKRRLRALGMIWSDQLFPGRAPRGMRLYTCFYGGAKDPEGNGLGDKMLARLVPRDMALALRTRPGTGPQFLEITRWERALPLFEVGYLSRLRPALAQLPTGLHLLSGYTGGISMPDRVEKARELAKTL